MTNPKKIDCIQIKRKGAAKIRQETRGMSIEEEFEFWKKGTADFQEWQKNQKKARKPAPIGKGKGTHLREEPNPFFPLYFESTFVSRVRIKAR